jgi:hypothetical protein
MNDGPNATWLPNLVGGVSIWKLAVDLNEPKFFDGRLLVPETEGSESLPVTVRWDLTNLLPLSEARAKHPAEVAAAITDFQTALGRVAKVFSTPDSGFDKYKAAFTVPSVEADNGGNYFYSPEKKKLYVINWGASPRSMAGRAEYVFGYEDWGKAFNDKGGGAAGAGSVSALAAAGAVGAAGAAAAVAAADPKKDDKKDPKKEKKDDGKKRPWWMWPLFALIAIALILLALFLLKACEEQKNLGNADGGEGGAEAAADGSNDSAAAGDGANEAGGDAAGAGDAIADAMAEAGADAAGADAGKDGGKDAGKDGSTGSTSDDDDDDDTDSDIEIGPDGKPVPGGKVTITYGGAPGGQLTTAKKGPHRRHFQAEAVKWRISAGNDRVTRSEARGRRFDVWLAPGRTFQGVGVEWQDKSGKWHAH